MHATWTAAANIEFETSDIEDYGWEEAWQAANIEFQTSDFEGYGWEESQQEGPYVLPQNLGLVILKATGESERWGRADCPASA